MIAAVSTDNAAHPSTPPRDRQHAQTYVYETIQRRILDGEYSAGERLTESRVVQALGVSRTPVREALQRLAAEGLVQLHPNRGATVAEIEEKDLEELFSLRILLEGFAAGLAAENATPEDILELRRIQDAFASAASNPSDESRALCSKINLEFHETLLRIADNQRLTTMVSSLSTVSLARTTFATYSESQLQRSVNQHDQIIEAVEHGDRNLAEMAMRVHINGARYAMVGELRTPPQRSPQRRKPEADHD